MIEGGARARKVDNSPWFRGSRDATAIAVTSPAITRYAIRLPDAEAPNTVRGSLQLFSIENNWVSTRIGDRYIWLA
jgi:hypothetical protein